MASSPTYVPASLIERLVDEHPLEGVEYPPRRAYTRADLLRSVEHNLHWLLNTRCPLGLSELERRQAENSRGILDYGIPDFGGFYTFDADDQKRLSRLLGDTIAFFEPRLRDVQVTLRPSRDQNHKGLEGLLEARLVVNEIDEPLAFPIVVDTGKNWHVSSPAP